MHPLIEQLLPAPPVLTDGAWGTQFQEEGLAPGDCPDAWNLGYPERIERLARSCIEAGSRLILTNTFRANRIALERPGTLRARGGDQSRPRGHLPPQRKGRRTFSAP